MTRLTPVMLALAVLLALSYTTSAQDTCSLFQNARNPKVGVLQPAQYCAQYNSSSCCDTGSAAQAYSFAYGDDGCGPLDPLGTCQKFLSDLACANECKPNLPLSVNGRTTVCRSWAETFYAACLGDFNTKWCLSNSMGRLMHSGCQPIKRNRLVRTTSGKSTTYKMVEETIYNGYACTQVSQLTMEEFLASFNMDVPATNSTVGCVSPTAGPQVAIALITTGTGAAASVLPTVAVLFFSMLAAVLVSQW